MTASLPRLQLLLAAFPIALGAFALAAGEMFPAWTLDNMAGIAYMAKGSAVCFVLSGAGLLAANRPGPAMSRLQAIAGAAVLAIAGLALLRSLLDYQPQASVWQYLFNARVDSAGPSAWPEEMCSASSVAFLFAGLALVQMTKLRSKAGMVMLSLGAALIGISLVCLLSAVLGNALLERQWPLPVPASVPTALGLIAVGAGSLLAALQTGRSCSLYREREDRRIFVTAITLFTLISMAAGMSGIGIVGRYAMTNFQDALWISFRANAELFRTSLNTAAARGGEIVRLSGLERLVDRHAPHAELQRELERVVRLAGYGELASMKILSADGETLARTGTETFSGQFNVRLPLAVDTRLYWYEGWRLLLRIPLGAGDGAGVLEVALNRFDQQYARMNHLGVSGETRVCIADGEWMRCFPSRLLSEPSRFPMSPPGRPLAMNLALNGEHGVTAQLDYRGKEVIAAYGMIDMAGLGLVQKFDADEFYQPLRRQLWYALLGLSLLIVAGASVLYWRTRPLVSGLVRAHARLDAILNNVPAAVITVDAGGFISSANRTAETMFGYREEQMLGMRFDQLLHAADTPVPNPPSGVRELTARRSGGEAFRVEVIESRFQLGRHSKRIVIIQDITQRRKMEDRLERWGHVFRHAGWGMMIGSADGTSVELMNPAFAQMHGYTVEELGGRPIAGLVAPAARMHLPERVRQMHAKGRLGFESLHLRKDGSVFPVWIDVAAVNDGQGELLYLAANVLDISERKEGEQRLRKLAAHMENVREEERKRIAREVHDELGQALTVLRMDVSMLRLNFGASNPELMARIQAMTEAVDRTIHMVRHVTSALRPAVLDLGLTAALEWLVEDFIGRFGINCELRTDDEDVTLNDSQATVLFRIAQESLTNVLKHAEASTVEVSMRVEDSRIWLQIRDNGRGFSTGAAAKAGAFGLLGMRERALMLGGNVEIHSVPGEGSCVNACLPLKTDMMTG